VTHPARPEVVVVRVSFLYRRSHGASIIAPQSLLEERGMAPQAEFQLSDDVLVPNFGGFGVQLNHHVFAPMTVELGAPETSFPDLRRKVIDLAPQVVRIFYNNLHEGVPFDESRPASNVNVRQTEAQKERWKSFVDVVKLAHDAGAIINITWQGGQVGETTMTRFANVLELLVKGGARNVRWATIANEPNTQPDPEHPPAIPLTPQRLGEGYRLLHRKLTERGIRSQIKLMGGDLIEGPEKPSVNRLHELSPFNQLAWFKHIASSHLDDILDAYSVHIYWNYDRTGREGVEKFERRLREVRRVVNHLNLKKPLFVTEFGTRGKDRNKQRGVNPGNFHGPGGARVPLCHSKIAPFQAAWFMIRAAQRGYAGMLKWDCYFGRYDLTPPPSGLQQFYAIGPPVPPGRREWDLLPMYHLLRLFNITTARGWKVLSMVPGERGSKHLIALRGPAGQLTLFGLDDRGATVNKSSKLRSKYRIGGLPNNTSFQRLHWNLGGGGKMRLEKQPVKVKDGVVTIAAPIHSVFALTTKKLPPL
jgi:hypothetical protein